MKVAAHRPPLLDRFIADLDTQSPKDVCALRPDLRAFAHADVDAARFVWAFRIVDEHRSVSVFAELLALLARVDAPFAALAAIQRLIGDELRHVRLCAGVVDWLGGREDLEIDLTDLQLPETDDPPAGRALEIVERELVVAETASVHVLRAYRDATTEPAIHAVLSVLLRDEVRHAATGRALSKLLRSQFDERALGSAIVERLPATLASDWDYVAEQYRARDRDARGRALGGALHREEVEAALAACLPTAA